MFFSKVASVFTIHFESLFADTVSKMSPEKQFEVKLKIIEDFEPYIVEFEEKKYWYQYSNPLLKILIENIIEEAKELNSLLEDKDKVKEVSLLNKDNIEAIQAKKFVTPKELAILHSDLSEATQKNYRGRLHNRLPYYQKVAKGKITYNLEEVEEWKKRENIR